MLKMQQKKKSEDALIVIHSRNDESEIFLCHCDFRHVTFMDKCVQCQSWNVDNLSGTDKN